MKITPSFVRATLASLCLSTLAPSAFSAWVKLEDFESYTIGQNVSATHGWFSSGATHPIVADPVNSANKVLSVPTDNSAIVRLNNTANSAVSIPNGTTATLFLRYRFNGPNMNFSFGMSDVSNGGTSGSFADFESQYNQNDTANTAHFRDLGAFANLVPASPLSSDTWYNIWMKIDNSADTTTVYIDRTTAPGGTTTALQSNGTKTAFTFRNGVGTNPLISFLIMTSGQTGTTYIDDIYIDSAGQNLTNPASPATNVVTTVNDSIEVGVQGVIGFDPSTNDKTVYGTLNPATLAPVTQPAHGVVTFDSVANKLVYRHTGATAGTDSFQYRVANTSGATGTGTVNVNVTGALRIANATMTLPQTPPASGSLQLVDALPGVTFDTAVVVTGVPGNKKSLILASINGSVWMVPDTTAATPVKKELFTVKTLSNFTRGRSIYSAVCAPDFATTGNIILTYQGDTTGLPPTAQIPNLDHLSDTDVPGNPIQCTLRVSRFTISPANLNTLLNSTDATAIANAKAAVLATEFRYINLAEQGLYHSINDCHFGQDGYLYVSFGDEGGQGEPCLNAQKITRDQYSSIIRIDLARKPGNLEPNPHYAIITDSGVARFKIPADNPYVGSNPVYNGAAIPANQLANVRTEIWATGLRNPFKFYIDDTDGGTGNVWVGDVGMDSWEKVTIMNKADDAGWSYWEGSHLRPTNVGNPTPIQPTTVDFPEYEYPHSQGNNSVMGGIFYRKAAYTGANSLTNKYLFGDFGSGRIWVLTPGATPRTPTITPLSTGGLANVVCFYVDPNTDEILILQHNSTGKLMRLIEAPVSNNTFPTLLSQTGAFANMQTLEPNPGVLPYTPNLKFWSDNADKSRYIVIQNLTDQIGYSQTGNWTFPQGLIMVKHFNMELNRDFPGTNTKRIETRFIVRNATGIYGISYRWNDQGTDATLVDPTGDDFDLPIRSGGTLQNGVVTGGTVTNQPWHIPAQSECLTCHNGAAASILSLTTQQLNIQGQIGQTTGNMLTLLSQSGYLSGFTDDPATLPRYYKNTETNVSVEERVRSFLTVNCTYCHRDGGGANQTWGTLGHETIDQMGILYGLPISESFHLPQDRYIIPGNKTNSLIWNRLQARAAIGDGTYHSYTQMPPLATNVVDQADVDLMSNWIDNYANVAPTIDDTSLTQATISEDSAVGTVLGSVTATDPDVRNGVTDQSALRYSLTGGNVNNAFAIDAVTGQITVNGVLKFQALSQYTLTVTASDNFANNPKTASQTVTVTLTAGTSNTDANNNGIPDAWENQYHLGGNPAADTDHDGISDFFEYLSGGDPTVPGSGLGLHVKAVIQGSPGSVQYEWRCRNGVVLGQTYYAQTSASLGGAWHTLASGEYTVISTTADGAGFSKVVISVPSGTNAFFRLSSAP